MKVEVFTMTFNEELILPYFIQHYRQRFSNITFNIYDNFSTDNTVEIAKAYGCNVFSIDTSGEIRDDILLSFKNNVWKNSTADWVIVCDCDEFVEINENDFNRSVYDNIFKCFGYEMVGNTLDIDQIRYGARVNNRYDKVCVFKPSCLKEINFSVGAHTCQPQGNPCTIWSSFRPIMYHMKYFHREFLIQRYAIFNQRLSLINKKEKWGFQYSFTRKQILKVFDLLESAKVVVRKPLFDSMHSVNEIGRRA